MCGLVANDVFDGGGKSPLVCAACGGDFGTMNTEWHDSCSELVGFLLRVDGKSPNAFCDHCSAIHSLIQRGGVGKLGQVDVGPEVSEAVDDLYDVSGESPLVCLERLPCAVFVAEKNALLGGYASSHI